MMENMLMKCRCVMTMSMLAGLAGLTWAQEPAPVAPGGPAKAQAPGGGLTAVRAKTDLTDEDRGLIRTFVSQRVTTAADTDAAAARQAADDLRAGFDGSDAFKREYAAAAIEAITAAYKTAPLPAATRLLAVLNSFNLLESQNLLLEALKDDRVGVRAAAAAGLRNLRPKIAAAGRDVFVKVLDALKEAGKREKSRDTLRTIYAAMDYFEAPSSPDAKADLAALLELLDARARQYAAGKVAALGADDMGLRMAQLAKNLDDTERQRLIVDVATMMKYAIEQYTSPTATWTEAPDDASHELLETRNGLERLIEVGEKMLTDLVKPEKAPAIAENMRKGNTEDMRSEWQKWVPLLQKAVNQDFALKEPPAEEEAAPGTGS
jgi:hypothetical protein